MDRLTTMSAFVQVVSKGSFSGAARQLQLSQAAVTGHVQSLEQQLGIRLLNRTTRNVSLTEEGTQFYQRCIRILAEVAEMDNLAKFSSSGAARPFAAKYRCSAGARRRPGSE